MNIDEITIALEQIKKIQGLLGNQSANESHPDIGKKVIVRTYSAGVFYGTLLSKKGKEVIIKDAIRIYYWEGACSLSQLAVDGTKLPENCKFAVPVEKNTVEYIEIITCSELAQKSIEGTASWRK